MKRYRKQDSALINNKPNWFFSNICYIFWWEILSSLYYVSHASFYKLLTSKLLRFRWQRECIQWKQSTQKAYLAFKRRILARLCFLLLSIILCVFRELQHQTWSFKLSWLRERQVDNLNGFESSGWCPWVPCYRFIWGHNKSLYDTELFEWNDH